MSHHRKEVMPSKSYIGAYWDARAQSVDDCAARLHRLFEQLAQIDPLLSGWRPGASSKRAAIAAPVISTQKELAEYLVAGQTRDRNGAAHAELGSIVGFWNGNPDDRAAAGLSVRCGATFGPNSVVLHLPQTDAAPTLYEQQTAQQLLRIIIDAWQPTRAVWTSNVLVDEQSEPDRPTEDGGFIGGQLVGHPAGWATFLSDTEAVMFDRALLPTSAAVQRVGAGTLVTLGDDPADPPLSDVLAVRAAMGYEVRVPDLKPSTPVSAPAQSTGTDAIPPLETGATPAAKQGERAGKAGGEPQQPKSKPADPPK
jgi:hypothetical protein